MDFCDFPRYGQTSDYRIGPKSDDDVFTGHLHMLCVRVGYASCHRECDAKIRTTSKYVVKSLFVERPVEDTARRKSNKYSVYS